MTDYYVTAEDGLIAFLKSELSAYFPNADKQVTASDDTVYDNGNDYYATTYPGSFPVTERSGSYLEYSWEIMLDILSRWKTTELAAWDAFKGYRSAVINALNHTLAGHSLDGTSFVKDAVIFAEERPRYIPARGSSDDNPIFTHIGQVCTVTVKQNVPIE